MSKENISATHNDLGITSEGKDNLKEMKRSLLQDEDNPVKQAAKKEQQPASENDLSSLNDNLQVGTTGGDQRATGEEIRQSFEAGESRNSKLNNGPKEPITEDPNEEDFPLKDPNESETPVVEDPAEKDAPIEYEPGGDGEPEIDYKDPEREKGSDEIF